MFFSMKRSGMKKTWDPLLVAQKWKNAYMHINILVSTRRKVSVGGKRQGALEHRLSRDMKIFIKFNEKKNYSLGLQTQGRNLDRIAKR
jgi:hypothetical protein